MSIYYMRNEITNRCIITVNITPFQFDDVPSPWYLLSCKGFQGVCLFPSANMHPVWFFKIFHMLYPPMLTLCNTKSSAWNSLGQTRRFYLEAVVLLTMAMVKETSILFSSTRLTSSLNSQLLTIVGKE